MPSSPPSNLTQSEQKTVLENTAIRYLSFRPRFKSEVITRLGRKTEELNLNDPLALINQIVDSLEKSGFINDEKLLEGYIRNRLIEKKKGPIWIRQHLSRLGLSRTRIDTALAQFADKQTQIDVLSNYLQKYPTQTDPKSKAKLFRRLLGRGFSASIISEIIGPTCPILL